MTEPLDLRHLPGRAAARCSLPDCDVPETPLPAGCVRDDLPLPEVAEIDLVRHYMRLSQLNHGIDTGFYPLGSCTMKYNPKVNEVAARLPGFACLHPLQPDESGPGRDGADATSCRRCWPRSPASPRSRCSRRPARTAS